MFNQLSQQFIYTACFEENFTDPILDFISEAETDDERKANVYMCERYVYRYFLRQCGCIDAQL